MLLKNNQKIFPLLLILTLSFTSGYALGSYQQVEPQKQEQSQNVDDEVSSVLKADKNLESIPVSTKDITIVFTVNEAGEIHILDVSGGYNLLTSYIRQSLEGRLLESGKAVPGINYVMTLKFPSSV